MQSLFTRQRLRGHARKELGLHTFWKKHWTMCFTSVFNSRIVERMLVFHHTTPTQTKTITTTTYCVLVTLSTTLCVVLRPREGLFHTRRVLWMDHLLHCMFVGLSASHNGTNLQGRQPAGGSQHLVPPLLYGSTHTKSLKAGLLHLRWVHNMLCPVLIAWRINLF